MAKSDAIAKAIAADPYLKKRKAPTEAEQQLYLKEVSFSCPLCGKILRHKKQGKANKLYEIAHIFPNSPTEEQYELLSKLPRLGIIPSPLKTRSHYVKIVTISRTTTPRWRTT